MMIIAAVLTLLGLTAQEMPQKMQSVYSACTTMQQAYKSGSSSGLRAANNQLKRVYPDHFASARVKGDTVSLNGHYIFDTAFADSLIVNKQVYKMAQEYAERDAHRGRTSDGKVCMMNLAVRKGGSATIKFAAKGATHIAVVAEPRAKVTLRIFDKNTGKYYNDDVKVDRGMPCRTALVPVPDGESHTIEVEVLNRTGRDASFVIIKG